MIKVNNYIIIETSFQDLPVNVQDVSFLGTNYYFTVEYKGQKYNLGYIDDLGFVEGVYDKEKDALIYQKSSIKIKALCLQTICTEEN